MDYFLSQAAEQDIEEALDYLAPKNKKAALDFLDSLYEMMNSLSENPFLGHVREDLTSYPVRFLAFKWHYLIVYKPSQPLEIVRVLSGYRDMSVLLEND